MLTAPKNKIFTLQESVCVPRTGRVDFSRILYVYKSKNGSWRGFAHPYDVTIEASTKIKALSALKEMVKEYEVGLIKYGFPAHLANRTLSDSEDNERFNALAFQTIIQQKKIAGFDYYAEAQTVLA